MMDGSDPQTTTADAPFDSTERADIILRSADNVDFYMTKGFLAFSSPVFGDMFSLPQPEKTHGLPVVDIAEQSAPLRNVLLFCYPGTQPTLKNAEDIIAAYIIAEKFKMESIMKQLEDKLLTSQSIKDEPLRIFAITTRMGLERAAKMAAKNTLATPLSGLPSSEELAYVTGLDLWRLLEYRQKCASAIRSWFARQYTLPALMIPSEKQLWNPWNSSTPQYHCTHPVEREIVLPTPTSPTSRGNAIPLNQPQWWTDYLVHLFSELDLCPSPDIILDNRLSDWAISVATSAHCTVCSSNIHRNVEKFKLVFANAVEEEIAKIPLNIDFSRSGERGKLPLPTKRGVASAEPSTCNVQ